MSDERELNLTELEQELRLVQEENERMMEQFTSLADVYVRSQSDIMERTMMLFANFSKFSSTYESTMKINAVDNPYVVVLLDGNVINFTDELVRANGNGGLEAAKRLSSAIEAYLSSTVTVPKNSRIMVRIYADLRALSAAAFKSNLVGLSNQPWALSPFASCFSQVNPFFDFVDVGDEDIVKIKVAETFRVFSEDPQCQLIILGVGLSPTYLDVVSAYKEYTGKLVLLRAGPVDTRYKQFGLKTVQFEKVFRLGTLHNESTGSYSAWKGVGMFEHSSVNDEVRTKRKGRICHHFANNGVCKWYNCKFEHVSNDQLIDKIAESTSEASKVLATNAYNPPMEVKDEMIPLNENNERIDIFMRPPTKNEWAIYRSCFQNKKPCNAYYMRKKCDHSKCNLDHTTIDPAAYYCLQYILKGLSCARGGGCRRLDCYNGHTCQKHECSAGKAKGCKMSNKAHEIDRRATKWVVPQGMITREPKSAQESTSTVPSSAKESGSVKESEPTRTAETCDDDGKHTSPMDRDCCDWTPHPESIENWVNSMENKSSPAHSSNSIYDMTPTKEPVTMTATPGMDYPLIDL